LALEHFCPVPVLASHSQRQAAVVNSAATVVFAFLIQVFPYFNGLSICPGRNPPLLSHTLALKHFYWASKEMAGNRMVKSVTERLVMPVLATLGIFAVSVQVSTYLINRSLFIRLQVQHISGRRHFYPA
jgi:hypothetical protein